MRRGMVVMVAACVILLAAMSAFAQTPGQVPAQGQGTVVQASEQVVIHFFVVPRVLPGGKEAAGKFPDLRKFLAKTAGGYSQLGSCDGGSLLPSGEVRAETNICFMVSAPRDVSAEIAAYLKTHFENKSPFVLSWPGSRH
ncbi:MAG: hypothetical protein RDU30_14600 [Desulfovibrionaceae bacterium]|nr:hypothetical protein [Desulfovibrionaceae bacterium]